MDRSRVRSQHELERDQGTVGINNPIITDCRIVGMKKLTRRACVMRQLRVSNYAPLKLKQIVEEGRFRGDRHNPSYKFDPYFVCWTSGCPHALKSREEIKQAAAPLDKDHDKRWLYATIKKKRNRFLYNITKPTSYDRDN